MTEYGRYSAAPVPPPPGDGQTDGEKKSDQPVEVPLWAIIAAGVVALALVVVAGVMILRPPGRQSGATGPLPTSKPSYPATWNHKIKPIADQTAVLRGLNFQHPVPVRFLAPAKFEKTLRGEQDELSKEDRVELEHVTGLLRALGMLSGDIDLQKAVSGFEGGAVLAYYNFDDERITVRGKKITPDIKATLVHELTHVLQDQNFNVGGRLQTLRKEADKGPSGSAASILEAIVEGDAERVRYLYQAALKPPQRQALAAAQARASSAARKRVSDIPPLVVTEMSSPYVLGEALVQVVASKGGNGAVDAMFRKPPTHESALIDPYRVLAHDMKTTKVEVPALESGEKEFDSGELGVLTWYFMLAQRLPLSEALAAADGWGGDAYVGFDRGDTTCARLSFAGRTVADTARMETALGQWGAATPGEQTVTSGGKVVTVASCDPGTGGPGGVDHSADAMGVLSTRTQVMLALTKNGASVPVARCAVGRLLDAFTVEQLNDPNFGQDAATQTQLFQIGASCR